MVECRALLQSVNVYYIERARHLARSQPLRDHHRALAAEPDHRLPRRPHHPDGWQGWPLSGISELRTVVPEQGCSLVPMVNFIGAALDQDLKQRCVLPGVILLEAVDLMPVMNLDKFFDSYRSEVEATWGD